MLISLTFRRSLRRIVLRGRFVGETDPPIADGRVDRPHVDVRPPTWTAVVHGTTTVQGEKFDY